MGFPVGTPFVGSGAGLVLPVTQAQVVQRVREERGDGLAIFEGQHRKDDDADQDRDDERHEDALL